MTNQKIIPKKAILRPSEAAQYLGLSESTLAKRRLRGDSPRYVKLGSRAVGYPLDELKAYIATCLRTSTSDEGDE